MIDNNVQKLWSIIQALNSETKSPAEERIQDALGVILDEMQKNQR